MGAQAWAPPWGKQRSAAQRGAASSQVKVAGKRKGLSAEATSRSSPAATSGGGGTRHKWARPQAQLKLEDVTCSLHVGAPPAIGQGECFPSSRDRGRTGGRAASHAQARKRRGSGRAGGASCAGGKAAGAGGQAGGASPMEARICLRLACLSSLVACGLNDLP